MDILERVKLVLTEDINEAQLDKFLSDVRDSLASSNKLFIAYTLLIVTALVTYHLVAYSGATGLTLNALQLPDPSLIKRVFLLVPAGLLVAKVCVAYLRRCQREVYDLLMISRYRVLGSSGLHELRLPADYILGLNYLRNEGSALGVAIANIVAVAGFLGSVLIPAAYIVCAAYVNVRTFGMNDTLCLLASGAAAFMALVSLEIVRQTMHVKAE